MQVRSILAAVAAVVAFTSVVAFATAVVEAPPAVAPPAVTPTEVSPPEAAIAAAVDPRVEFMAAVARVAGFDEYRMANASSPYSAKVDALFAPHASHRAFEQMRAMRKRKGLSYDAVMSLALHVGAPPLLVERVNFDARPPRLDARLEPAPTRELLASLRDLAARVDWAAFAASQKQLYDTAASRLAQRANQVPAIPWFDRTLGMRAGASYQLVPGLLNGGQNYGVGVQFLDGSPEEIRPVIGCWKWDAQGLPEYGDSVTELVAHELCHSYTNAVVDTHAADFKQVGEQLFAMTAKQMERQAYGTWKTVMYETVVRALVVRYLHDTLGAEASARQAADDVKRGFSWVPAVAAAFDAYDADRAKYPTIDTFVPVIVATLKGHASKMKSGPPAPRLVRSDPADGATNVSARSGTLRLEFDQPMRTDTYSITGSVHDLPADIKVVHTENDGRVWHLRMNPEPGRTYSIGLNGGKFRGFKSREGVALEFVMIRITTAAK